MMARREAEKLLQALRRAKSISEVARIAGVSEARARMLLAYLASRGLIGEAAPSCGLDCGGCPLKGVCRVKGARLVYVESG